MKRFLFPLFTCLALSAFAARVDTISLESKFLHKTTKCVVVTPETTKKKLPVVYLLHGFSGNYAGWLKEAPQLLKEADELQFVLVCPDGGYGSWYFDSPIDSSIRYESYIIQELLPYIDQHYPVIADRNARAITGLSMGGHGALYLASRHKELFAAAGSMAGGVDFRPFPNNWDIKKALGTYAENPSLWDEHVVIKQVELLQNKDLALIIDCGLDDFFLTVNRNLHQKLMNLKIEHDYTERPGMHNKAYWSNSVDFQLLFFQKKLSR